MTAPAPRRYPQPQLPSIVHEGRVMVDAEAVACWLIGYGRGLASHPGTPTVVGHAVVAALTAGALRIRDSARDRLVAAFAAQLDRDLPAGDL